MQFANQLAELKQARARGENWVALASRIRALENRADWRSHYATRLDWLHALNDLIGYSPSTIRSFLESLEFLERLAAERPHLDILKAALSSPDTKVSGIAAIPLLKRIHDVAPQRLDEVLPAVLKGEMLIKDLRRFYDREVLSRSGPAVAPAKLSRRISDSFTRHALDAVESALPALTGKKNLILVRKRFRFELVYPDAVAVFINGRLVEFADGFEMRQVASLPHPALRSRILADIAFAARFFRHYWLILPAGSRLTDYMIRALRQAGELSVGVAEATAGGEIVIKAKPQGKPQVDRQDVALDAIFQQGVPQAA